MSSMVGFSSSNADDFGHAADRLDEIARDLPRWVHQDVVTAAESIKSKAQQLVRAEPSHGRRHTGLRETVAQSISVDVSARGATVSVDMPGTSEDSLPRDLNTGTWRHPVFGTRKWVTQHVTADWFSVPVEQESHDVKNNIQDDLDRAARHVQGL